MRAKDGGHAGVTGFRIDEGDDADEWWLQGAHERL